MLLYSNKIVSLQCLMTNDMPRQVRKRSGTGIYHVMLRGINRQDIFEDDEVSTPVDGYNDILDIDTEEKITLSDSDIRAFLLNTHGIANPLMVQSLEKTRRNVVLKSAKSFGAGIRQLSRLTGVSFGLIQKL